MPISYFVLFSIVAEYLYSVKTFGVLEISDIIEETPNWYYRDRVNNSYHTVLRLGFASSAKLENWVNSCIEKKYADYNCNIEHGYFKITKYNGEKIAEEYKKFF